MINSKLDTKIIFVFHNNPQEIRGSKSVKERINILEKTDKIFFVSKWTFDKFFEGLPWKSRNNCEIVYPSIEPIKKFNNHKKKQIIFAGKLNSSKGYDIFGSTIIKILQKFPEWNAVGNEPREKFSFKHPKLKIYLGFHIKQFLIYTKILQFLLFLLGGMSFWKNSNSAAYGCATITSNKGGLPETFNNNFILKNLSKSELFKMISLLIKNKKKRHLLQKRNFNNVIHKLDDQVNFIIL